jgi:hypothetical protein
MFDDIAFADGAGDHSHGVKSCSGRGGAKKVSRGRACALAALLRVWRVKGKGAPAKRLTLRTSFAHELWGCALGMDFGAKAIK